MANLFKSLANGLSSIVNKKEAEPVKKTVTKVVKKTVVKEVKNTTVIKEPVTTVTSVDNTPETTVTGNYKQYNLAVVIDPGHAKTTPGKRSPYSLGKQTTPVLPFEEWQFNRELATLVVKELAKYGIETFITTDAKRDGDTDLKLTPRATRAFNFIKNSGKKGLFISIHADAQGTGAEWGTARGWSVFTTKGQTVSDTFAEYLYDEAEKIFKAKGQKIRTNKADGDRDWEENFTVIYKTEQLSMKNGKPTIPAVLIEHFFYTNVEDTKYLSSVEGKQDMMHVIVNAILTYAEKEYKL